MKPENETPWMTASQYSRHRCVSRQYVARLIKSGVLPMRGNLIDVVGADRFLDDRPGAASANGQTAASYGHARTIEMVFRAKLARLDYNQKTGMLMEAEPARSEAFRRVREMRDSFLTAPDRLSSVIAAESNRTKIASLLRDEFWRILSDLADGLAQVGLLSEHEVPNDSRPPAA